MEQSNQDSNTKENQNTLNTKKSKNLFKGRFNGKAILKGTTEWKHDPSGEELEIIRE